MNEKDDYLNKKTGKSKAPIAFIKRVALPLLLGAIFGAAIAWAAIGQDYSFLGFSSDKYPFLVIIAAVIIFVLAFLIQIICHEAGHLLFGLLSGYSFVSFRIGSLTLVREGGKFELRKFAIPGTAGQCLMMPPDMTNGKFPYVLYNLGGVLINLILAVVSFIVLIYFNCSGLDGVFLIMMIASGLFCLATNGIPMQIGGVSNDGYNALSIGKNPLAAKAFYLSLKINGLLSEGMRLKDMPAQWFELPDDFDYNTPMVTVLKILQAQRWHDLLQFDQAQEIYKNIRRNTVNLILAYDLEIRCELLFYELIGQNRPEVVCRRYNKQLRKYIDSTKYNISRVKVNYAYALYAEHDEAKAAKIYKSLDQLSKSYPLKGETASEMEVVEWVKKKYEYDKQMLIEE